MTNDIVSAGQGRVTGLLRRWWPYLLGLSLMANLLIGGLVIGHGFRERGSERMAGTGLVQLVPRDFFGNLPRERRLELLRDIREQTHGLRDMRDGSSDRVLKFADALEAQDYKPENVAIAVNDFSTGEGSIASQSSKFILDMVAKLSPEERMQLATAVRDRAAHVRERRGQSD